jgi:putative flippase GtrA
MYFSFITHKLFKYASIGVVATFVHVALYLVILHRHPNAEQVANLFGFFVAVFVSYLGQRRWAFATNKVTSESLAKIKFFLSSLISLALNAIWVFLTVNVFYLPSQFAVVGIVLITPFIVYLILNLWVFT